MTRRTKIVCTIGPASDDKLDALLEAGMDCARLNFSHGSYDEHRLRYQRLRDAEQRAGRPLAILQDLQGPKIRVGKVQDPGIELRSGDGLTITNRTVVGQPGLVSTTYQNLPLDVQPGDRILLDDGLLELEVLAKTESEVTTRVVLGGLLKSNKGINLPGVKVSAPALTPKDREDLKFGLSLGVDYVALSFVRDPKDLLEAKALIREAGRDVPLIAKLEKPEAVDKLEAIADATDGLMVARGDLGVELRAQRVPMIQKRAIEVLNARSKVVITATQMLDSMIQNPRPTRAEASDVANAVLDGTDAVMLSGETAAGKYPVEAVSMMREIILEVENSERYQRNLALRRDAERKDFRSATASAAVAAARDLEVSAIACLTHSGRTAELLSERRPTALIVALTHSETIARRLALHWGVAPVLVTVRGTTEALVAEVDRILVHKGLAKHDEPVVLTLGRPGGESWNLLLLHRVGVSQ
jgi:pyruvate kinase